MAYTPGKGTLVKNGATTITQARNVKLPKRTMGEADNTHLGSTAEENAPTIRNEGQLEFEILYDPAAADHAAILAAYVAGTVATWHGILADAGACDESGSGWVKEWDPTPIVVGQSVVVKVIVRITGAWTVTP